MTYIQRSIINPSEPFVSIIAQNLIRHTILIWNILFSFLLIPAGILIASLFSNELWLLDDPYFIPLGSMLVILCSAYWIMTLFLSRLYGQSLHKGFMLLNFIPILNSFFSMYLLNGPKEQFTHPFEVLRHTRTLENVLAILYVIFVLLISVIAIIMPIG